jgi:peptide/nickel transport system ATP-binding protein
LFTYIFISHDLAVVKYMSDQVLVMNQGRIEEIADADTCTPILKKEYTKMLIEAIPREAKISLTDTKTGHGK